MLKCPWDMGNKSACIPKIIEIILIIYPPQYKRTGHLGIDLIIAVPVRPISDWNF